MEEDIKILEEFKTKGYAMLLMKYGDRNTTNLKLEQAIENLIKRNKELEEENIHWKGQYHLENRKYIDLHNKKIDIPIINATEEMLQQYIPKSKIKEKIEELNRKITYIESQYTNGGQNCNSNYLSAFYQKQILQELLEKR